MIPDFTSFFFLRNGERSLFVGVPGRHKLERTLRNRKSILFVGYFEPELFGQAPTKRRKQAVRRSSHPVSSRHLLKSPLRNEKNNLFVGHPRGKLPPETVKTTPEVAQPPQRSHNHPRGRANHPGGHTTTPEVARAAEGGDGKASEILRNCRIYPPRRPKRCEKAYFGGSER